MIWQVSEQLRKEVESKLKREQKPTKVFAYYLTFSYTWCDSVYVIGFDSIDTIRGLWDDYWNHPNIHNLLVHISYPYEVVK